MKAWADGKGTTNTYTEVSKKNGCAGTLANKETKDENGCKTLCQAKKYWADEVNNLPPAE